MTMKRDIHMKKILIILLTLFIFSGCSDSGASINDDNNVIDELVEVDKEDNNSNLDLSILKLENKKENVLCSPLSIKYCLSILSEGASGNSKKQLDNLIGSYIPKNYTNSKNMSLVNMVILKDSLSNNASEEFKNTIKEKYNGEFKLDSFSDPSTINNWISSNTFNMINNYISSFDPDLKLLIINALAIDMEWINYIQNYFRYNPDHEQYDARIFDYSQFDCPTLEFNGSKIDATEFMTVANKYDIIKELGEDNIREIVSNDLREQLNNDSSLYNYMSQDYNTNDIETIINIFLEEYINTISKNYGDYDESTDFYYFIDDSINVFGKDLKEYDGTQLQFVAIMPKNEELNSYIDKLSEEDLDTIINSLKKPSYDDFEEGYITEIIGLFPTFSFTYDLDLKNDLKQLGVTDIFELNNDFNKVVGDQKIYVDAKHKTTIDLSNEGIKASALTVLPAMGAAGPYDYIFEVPIKTIEFKFDKPFLFVIRDKNTNENWFLGTLYNIQESKYKIEYPEIPYIIVADALKIRKEPSITSEQIGLAKKDDFFIGTGNTIWADGYSWYELKDGGWIADNGQWVQYPGN